MINLHEFIINIFLYFTSIHKIINSLAVSLSLSFSHINYIHTIGIYTIYKYLKFRLVRIQIQFSVQLQSCLPLWTYRHVPFVYCQFTPLWLLWRIEGIQIEVGWMMSLGWTCSSSMKDRQMKERQAKMLTLREVFGTIYF